MRNNKSVLVIGMGRFGQHIVKKFTELGDEVMAVDSDEKMLQQVEKYVTKMIIGDSTDEEFLHSLAPKSYDICIVTLGRDFQTSLETTSLLKELGAKRVISRATSDRQEKFLKRNGADEVVYPEKEHGYWMAMKCSANHILSYTKLDDEGEYGIFEIEVPYNWIGKTIIQLDVRGNFGINVIAIKDSDTKELQIENIGQVIIKAGDNLIVVGKYEKVKNL